MATVLERLMRRVVVDEVTGCWLWQGAVRRTGYAPFSVSVAGEPRDRLAHRVAYEQIVGPVPDGLVLDHLCRVRHCINPEHLEPVTQRENLLRGVGVGAVNAKKTHCPRGHEYDRTNSAGRRLCSTCQAASQRRSRERKRGESVKVVVVVPWRAAPGRWRAYAEVREWYAQNFPDYPVIISAASPLGDFNLAAARNAGVARASRQCSADVVIINDADTIPEKYAIDAAVATSHAEQVTVLPYGEYRSLMEHGTEMFRRGVPLEQCSHLVVGFACSGVFVTTPTAWSRTHGQDEVYRGWGMEDVAWLIAHRVLAGGEPRRIDGARVFAMHHPSAVKEGPQYEANVARLRRYEAAANDGRVDEVRRLARGGE